MTKSEFNKTNQVKKTEEPKSNQLSLTEKDHWNRPTLFLKNLRYKIAKLLALWGTNELTKDEFVKSKQL